MTGKRFWERLPLQRLVTVELRLRFRLRFGGNLTGVVMPRTVQCSLLPAQLDWGVRSVTEQSPAFRAFSCHFIGETQ
jgi:hypothetical protein